MPDAADRYAFRPVARSDLPLIAVWLAAPHVARWWGRPADELRTIEAAIADPAVATFILLIDGEPAGVMETDQIFWLMISWSGLDIGLDRGTTVADYDGSGQHMGPYAYTGQLVRVTVDLMTDQDVDHEEAGAAGLARE
jgi:arylsulfatase